VSGGLQVDGHSQLVDVSCQHLDVSGNVILDSQILEIKNDFVFDTLLLKNPSSSNYLHIRCIQVWVNGSDILPTYTSSTTSVGSGIAGDVIELIDYTTMAVKSSGSTASNIRTQGITPDYAFHGSNDLYEALYVPLTQSYKMSELQCITIYNRSGSEQGRLIGYQLELYNRTIDPSLSDPITIMPIEFSSNYYRFDFPDIVNYSKNSFSTDFEDNIESTSKINYIGAAHYLEDHENKKGIIIHGTMDISCGLKVGKRIETQELKVKENGILFDNVKFTFPLASNK